MKIPNLLVIVILFISSCAGTKDMSKEMMVSKYASTCPDSTESRILIQSASHIDADSSIIYGHILSNVDYKPMIGATVVLTNPDTDKQIGTVTDFDGEFLIILEAGMYNMEVKYIGSDSVALMNLAIRNREILKLLIGLNCKDFSDIVVKTGYSGTPIK